jgi:hypothetical protein
MDEKMLESEVKNEVRHMLSWMKKIRKNIEKKEMITHGHCNGFSSHCCLSCNRCWGKLK